MVILKEMMMNFVPLAKKKQAKYCYSTVNLPLFKESDDTLIIEKCIIPELHL